MNKPGSEYKLLFDLLKQNEVNIPAELDHGKFVALLERHRLFSLVNPLLDKWPEGERARLKEELQQKALKSLKLSNEVVELIDYLEEKHIRVILLKGPVLAVTLYGDIGHRHFNDIDLLVSKEDLSKTIDLMEKINFRLVYPKPLNERKWKRYMNYKKDVGLYNSKRTVLVELHYGIYVHKLLTEENEKIILGSTEKIELQHKEIEVLCKESTVLYLMFHGCLHQYFRLFWLRDIAVCFKKWKLNHFSILTTMKELGLERILGVTLLLLQKYFNTEIPEVYASLLAHDRDQLDKLVAISEQRIISEDMVSFTQKLQRHRFMILLKPGMRYKSMVIWSIFQRWRIKVFMGGH